MSKIEWTDATWNPVTGCSKVSEGCRNCYAEKMSHRFKWTDKPWNNINAPDNVKLHSERLEQPLKWRKPRMVFVNSMSDLFHEQVPFEFIDKVFAVMALAPQHTFQMLTKRPERMLEYMNDYDGYTDKLGPIAEKMQEEFGWLTPEDIACFAPTDIPCTLPKWPKWPLPNVWLGVSVENQKAANERIPLLLETPAAVRFLSCEPLLGEIDLGCDTGGYIHWVICGGESGPGARPMHPDWARSLRDQCQAKGIPIFIKQMGSFWAKEVRAIDQKGGNWNEWSEDLKVRCFPNV